MGAGLRAHHCAVGADSAWRTGCHEKRVGLLLHLSPHPVTGPRTPRGLAASFYAWLASSRLQVADRWMVHVICTSAGAPIVMLMRVVETCGPASNDTSGCGGQIGARWLCRLFVNCGGAVRTLMIFTLLIAQLCLLVASLRKGCHVSGHRFV